MEVKQLAPEHAQIMTILADPMLDPDMVKDSIQGLTKEEVADIVDAFADHISDLADAADANRYRAEEFRSKSDSYKYQVEQEKAALEKLLRLHGDRKIQTQYYTVGIQKNGGLAPLEIDGDIEDIPADYLIEQEPKINRDKVRELLKTKKVSWAHSGERGESLRIK